MSEEARDRRRAQILEAVVNVIVAGGTESATFRTIAEEARVSVRLVQYYFGEKDRLLAAALAFVRADIAELVADRMATLEDSGPRETLWTICESFLPVDERRRRAMLAFIALGTAALTDDSLRSPGSLRRGRELADVIAGELRRSRSDAWVDDDALLLTSTIAGIGNGMLAGEITEGEGRRLMRRAVDQALDSGVGQPSS